MNLENKTKIESECGCICRYLFASANIEQEDVDQIKRKHLKSAKLSEAGRIKT